MLVITRRFILLQNNIAVAARHILKHKVFAGITIFALSVSMAACILIFQYASFELSFDRHYPNSKSIYRLNLRTFDNNVLRSESAGIPDYVMQEIRDKVPGLDGSVKFEPTIGWFDCAFTYRERDKSVTFNERRVSYTEPSALDIFNYRVIEGDKKNALVQPYTALVSRSTSLKYFGSEDPVGKVLQLRGSGESHEFTVTGVFEDMPVNSHFSNDILLSLSPSNKGFDFDYLVINAHTRLHQVQEKLDVLAKEYPGDPGQRFEFVLEPVTNIHLFSKAEDGATPTGNPTLIYFLLGVAFIVLILAWINYVNLSVARSFSRAKEVGIRKTAGATYRNVINQFLTETFLYNIISFVFAGLLIFISAQWFYEFVGITFPWDKMYWMQLGATGWIIATVLFGGIFLSGVLPARIMAAIPTINVLKGKFSGIRGGIGTRRISVVFQFVCTIALLMVVIAVNRQFGVMIGNDPGIDYERTLIIKSPSNTDSTYRTKLNYLKTSLQQHAIVENVFSSGNIFSPGSDWWSGIVHREKNDMGQRFMVNLIDPGFIDGYGLKLLAGRNFGVSDYPGSHFGDKIEPLILNETGAKRLGFNNPDEAIGATVYWELNECRVIGVINDFHQLSMKSPVVPSFFTANNGPSLSLQLMPGVVGSDLPAAISTIKKEWDQFFPENAFEYWMLTDLYSELYNRERQMKNVFQFFCALAIIISCLGLFALSLFSVTRRAKEMSIRKVLGAPSVHLLHLLTREYIFVFFIAALVALPITWLAIEQWLDTFALRVNVNAVNFVLPLVLVAIFAFISIAVQTLRVIIKNPTHGLKSE